MPKGKIEAFATALIETNTKLLEAQESLAACTAHSIKDNKPFDQEQMIAQAAAFHLILGLTRSNLMQLQTMLQEAYERGV